MSSTMFVTEQPMVEVWTGQQIVRVNTVARNMRLAWLGEAGPPAPVPAPGPEEIRPAHEGDVIDVPCDECDGGERPLPGPCEPCSDTGTIRVRLVDDLEQLWRIVIGEPRDGHDVWKLTYQEMQT